MNWRNLLNRIKGSPKTLEADLGDELAFHREMKEQELRASGLSPEEAHVEANRRIGNLTLAREDARASWRFTWISDLGRDLLYGVRALRAQPGFTLLLDFA